MNNADQWKKAERRAALAAEEFAAAMKEKREARQALLNELEGTVSGLTDREKQVLSLIRKKLVNKEIASALNVSERTIKFHVSSLLKKFAVDSRNKL